MKASFSFEPVLAAATVLISSLNMIVETACISGEHLGFIVMLVPSLRSFRWGLCQWYLWGSEYLLKPSSLSQAWWLTRLESQQPEAGRSMCLTAQPGELQDSWGYTEKACQNKNKTKQNKPTQ